MKTTINENQRGLLFKNGRYQKMLVPGRYFTFGGSRIEVVALDQPLRSETCSLDTLLADKDIAGQTTVCEVFDGELALCFVNGKFAEALVPGRYAFWTVYDRYTFTVVATDPPEVPSDVSPAVFDKIPSSLTIKAEVPEYQKALLFFDNKYQRTLDAGVYRFWKDKTDVRFVFADTRLTRLDVTGQEILTLDKVTLRVNFVCNFRIVDFEKAVMEIDDYREQTHIAAQLALREYIGRHRIDEILENREQISARIRETLKEKARAFYVGIEDAGIKDIILPGEIRDIMNTVITAEKRAQANLIMRREEVASTRSLLNTARLMDENKTLYKLKELEYLEQIASNISSVSVDGSESLLSKLTAVIGGSEKRQN